jgi:D-glycero-D-manno-heptose 1,7-bisphosphate phosphatase
MLDLDPSEPRSSAERPRGAIDWVFLDRDGTLNVKRPRGSYVAHPDQLELLPGAAAAVARLNRAGLRTCLVTNQRGIALGLMSNADLDAVHERLVALLGAEGGRLDAIYACPHEEGQCSCRKPAPGLLLRAQAEQPEIDFARSVIVGDAATDMQVGRALGLHTVMIAGEQPPSVLEADLVVGDLAEAVELVIAMSRENGAAPSDPQAAAGTDGRPAASDRR